MILYVMRHAEAVEASESLADEWRYLTEKGRSAACKTISAISKSGPKPRLIITSPLTRAVQTAEIAALKACRKNVVVSSALLLPDADTDGVITHLKSCRGARCVMLVGHEPQLGQLVASLLGLTNQALALKKGACVALEYKPEQDDKPAGFICYLVPGQKKITSIKKAFPSNS